MLCSSGPDPKSDHYMEMWKVLRGGQKRDAIPQNLMRTKFVICGGSRS